MTTTAGAPSVPQQEYPYVNVGKFGTWVLIVFYDQARDVLRVSTNINAEGAELTLPDGITVRYNPQNGDILSIEVKALQGSLLPGHSEMAEHWRQVKALHPTPYRVELTPFLQGLLAHVQQVLVGGQDRSVFQKPVNIRMNWT